MLPQKRTSRNKDNELLRYGYELVACILCYRSERHRDIEKSTLNENGGPFAAKRNKEKESEKRRNPAVDHT